MVGRSTYPIAGRPCQSCYVGIHHVSCYKSETRLERKSGSLSEIGDAALDQTHHTMYMRLVALGHSHRMFIQTLSTTSLLSYRTPVCL